MDDPNFLALARHARPNPLKLYDFTINRGRVDERAFDILANPPFGPWYAALLLPIAQDREWIYHVGFWPFLVLALFGAYRLGRRFAPEQRNWTVIWTAVSPAVVLASHTIMPDVPLLAFYASGVALAIEGLDIGKPMLACWGGLLAGLSALFRYSGMTAIPLLLLYVVLHRIRPRIAVWTLAASAAPILIWTWLSSHVYGRIHWLAMAGFEGQTLAATDQQFAESYRSYVASLPPPAAQRWFTGHWGLQHYLEKAGAHSLSSEDRRSPRPGDEIVVPTYAWPQSPPRGLHATLRSSTVLPGSIPLRTFTAEGRACFYSNILAPGPTMVWLPFGFSAGPLEVLTRWEVLP